MTDLVCEGPSAIHAAGVVDETAEIVLKRPYSPQTVLPQRWAVSLWGEACWTYMAMWTPEALSRLQERTPNVAVFFHELGESLRRDMQASPTLDEWWRNPRTERPTQQEIEADPVTVVAPERPAPAALPPPKHAVPDMFHRTVTAPSASAAMAELLKEITGVTFHALQVLQTAQRDTLENFLTVEQRHRFSEQLTALSPAGGRHDAGTAGPRGPHFAAADGGRPVGAGRGSVVRDPRDQIRDLRAVDRAARTSSHACAGLRAGPGHETAFCAGRSAGPGDQAASNLRDAPCCPRRAS